MTAVNKEEQYIALDLTKKQIEESPSLDTDKPVSQQFEQAYFGYYGYPMYWGGSYTWGFYPYIERDHEKWRQFNQGGEEWDPNLRSTRDVTGYHIQATDGEIGHVEDFVIDDETWAIRYLIIATRNWLPGQKVLVSPRWIDRVSWDESKVYVSIARETIKESPNYVEGALLTRDYEDALHRHYHREGYWVDERDSGSK